MKLQLAGKTVYQSSFDPETGTLVREVELWYDHSSSHFGFKEALTYDVQKALRERFPRRWETVPSPSPELIDVGITDRCEMACPYCYVDSQPHAAHAPKELITNLLGSLAEAPYQIALGGGEPTTHPDFIWILQQIHHRGTVPNYTTAGNNITDKILEATNALCGGVAMTFHAYKGFDWFAERYRRLKKGLTCQLNVHLIADIDVAKNLRTLTRFQKEVGPINLVLLAYYPDVGRASLDRLMDRTTYSLSLPEALFYAASSGMKIAFSEGLLPYFLSRPELPINTTFASPCEGRFSCYVSPQGAMTVSSFGPSPNGHGKTLLEGGSAQDMWERLPYFQTTPHNGCCPQQSRCSATHIYHKFLCAQEPHNKLPLKSFVGNRTIYQKLLENHLEED